MIFRTQGGALHLAFCSRLESLASRFVSSVMACANFFFASAHSDFGDLWRSWRLKKALTISLQSIEPTTFKHKRVRKCIQGSKGKNLNPMWKVAMRSIPLCDLVSRSENDFAAAWSWSMPIGATDSSKDGNDGAPWQNSSSGWIFTRCQSVSSPLKKLHCHCLMSLLLGIRFPRLRANLQS